MEALGEALRRPALALWAAVDSAWLVMTGHLTRSPWRGSSDEGELARRLRQVRAARRLRKRLVQRER
jgi:hypothetical protein